MKIKMKGTDSSKDLWQEKVVHHLRDKRYGRLLTTIDDIKEHTKHISTSIPVVVAIGEENAGKSATLELLTSVPVFPSGEDNNTQMPIRLRLIKDQKNRKCLVYFPQGKIPNYPEIKIEADLDYVIASNLVKHTVHEIHTMYLHSEGKSQGTVPFELVVQVRSPDIPTLDIVDLPGIRTYPPAAKKETLELAEKYIQGGETIILCVIESNINRFENSEAYRLVETTNRQQQTLLVLTKVDKLSVRQYQKKIIKRVKCEEQSADFGIVAVANCDSEEHESGHQPNHDRPFSSDIRWFEENLPELDIHHEVSCVGLASKIDQIIVKHVAKSWLPAYIRLVSEKVKDFESQIHALGKSFSHEEISEVQREFEKQWPKHFDETLQLVVDFHIRTRVLSKIGWVGFVSQFSCLSSIDDIKEKHQMEKELLDKYVERPTIVEIANNIITKTLGKIFFYQTPNNCIKKKKTHARRKPTRMKCKFFNLCCYPNLDNIIQIMFEEEIMNQWEISGKKSTKFLLKKSLQEIKQYKLNQILRTVMFDWFQMQAHLLAIEELILPIQSRILSTFSQKCLPYLLKNEGTVFQNTRSSLEDQVKSLKSSLDRMYCLKESSQNKEIHSEMSINSLTA